jgi:hypothetical protein
MLDFLIRKLGLSHRAPEKCYKDEFVQAFRTAKEFSLDTPDIEFSSKKFISDERLDKLPQFLVDRIGAITPEMIFVQCFYFHLLARDHLEDFFNAPIYFTLGYVETPEKKYFYHTKKDLKTLLANGMDNPEMNLHAWLTLPSMEIIDLTLPGSIAQARGDKPPKSFGIIANHADQLLNGCKYHPTLVGDDFLVRIGGIREFTVFE